MPKKTPDDFFNDKIEFILASIESLSKSVDEYTKRLYELILLEYMPLFKVKDGFIENVPENDRLILMIDRYFDKLSKAMYNDVLSGFAGNVLKSVSLSGEYYVAMGFKKTVVDELIKTSVRLEEKLGITAKGNLKKSGYLYRLGQTEPVRQELKNYVLKSLSGDVSFLDFQKGFRDKVTGNKRLNVNSALQQYFDQYAYDSFNQLDEAANSQIAKGLNLHHFIYEGSVIKTTRPFCEKRAGKAFSVEETKKWKDDPDLIDKKTKDSYNPLIERGRYRCRHFIKYITEALYRQLTGKKAA